MKKATVLLMTLIMMITCFSFTACAPNASTDTPPDPEPPKDEIVLTAFGGATKDICNTTIRSYINNKANYDTLAETLYQESVNQVVLSTQDISFIWEDNGATEPYTAYFADNTAFDNAFTVETWDTGLTGVGFFIPGKTYYWKVVDAEGIESKTDSFTVLDEPTRWISAGTMRNVRDCGGWETLDGQTVKYSLLYRGDDPNENADAFSKKVFDYLGINGEIDLRVGSQYTVNYFNATSPFLNAGINYFYQIVPGEYDYSTAITDAIGEIFTFLADEDNYPVYFHCSHGKDRTGTLATILYGILGVGYDDIMCEYELSSFGKNIDSQPRNNLKVEGNTHIFTAAADDPWGAVGRLYYVLNRDYSNNGTLSFADTVKEYLMSACNVTLEEINSFRSIMLQQQ